jgi:hypothetical protein
MASKDKAIQGNITCCQGTLVGLTCFRAKQLSGSGWETVLAEDQPQASQATPSHTNRILSTPHENFVHSQY